MKSFATISASSTSHGTSEVGCPIFSARAKPFQRTTDPMGTEFIHRNRRDARWPLSGRNRFLIGGALSGRRNGRPSSPTLPGHQGAGGITYPTALTNRLPGFGWVKGTILPSKAVNFCTFKAGLCEPTLSKDVLRTFRSAHIPCARVTILQNLIFCLLESCRGAGSIKFSD